MRWEPLTLDTAPGQPQLPLAGRGAVRRTFDTPGFAGMTFHEVRARSVLNRVPEASRVPFRWTVNPYRGCTHACVYCFARGTHAYLDLDTGHDFDTQIVVKVNAPEVLRRELARPAWRGEHVALGTNVDPYQRAEGRYRLTPGIIGALRDSRTPLSVLTKGTLVLRDRDLLAAAAEVVPVGMSVSVGTVERDLAALVEPGAPSPRRRLEVCRAFADAGIGCSVLMAPVLPHLSDSDAAIDATVAAVAAAGACAVVPIALHLRPGAREWWFGWLAEHHPDLIARYQRLYARGAYTPKAYQDDLAARVAAAARRHGVGRGTPARTRRLHAAAAAHGSAQGSAHRSAQRSAPRQLALM